ncbi:MAG TPA: biotin--[acetyl-CoA-carboxylase] ligase, partial [Gemmatimonadaceae bacterium]|nr:biotin--[acetyl-CoA-carboxylase] ligase [Gemmatimonadaceae bacterium]
MTEPLYDGVSAAELAQQLGLPVVVYETVTSTLDVAHEHAGRGTTGPMLILADTQTAGRGRSGHHWSSPANTGIWLTLLTQSTGRAALDVLSLRVGLCAAHALDPFTAEPIQLKWPNDLYVAGRKLAGTLVEARWRQDIPEWVAIGFGVNVTPPSDQPGAIGLDVGTRRLDVLPTLITELCAAATAQGPLTQDELEEFNARDLARGKYCLEPARGYVRGITPAGELVVELADATIKIR